MGLPMYKKKEKPRAFPNVKHVIAVAAGKGGVGKSTVSVNLALSLHYLGYNVGVMDCDIYGPSIRKMLPEDRPPTQKDAIITPALCRGIQMISMAYFRKSGEAAAVRAPIANGIISQFIQNVEWGALDYLILDFPPGTGDIQLTLAQQANLTGAVMVTTPQDVAIMDVCKAIDLFSQVKVPIIGIVENMSYYQPNESEEKVYIFGKSGGKNLADKMKMPFLGEIPICQEVCSSGDCGIPLILRGDSSVRPSALPFLSATKAFIKEIEAIEKEAKNSEVSFKKLDAHTIAFIWDDNAKTQYRFSDLQKFCPCANCVDESTGKRKVSPNDVDENVEAIKIETVGRYGVKIQFSSGCSTGIYSYEALKNQLAFDSVATAEKNSNQ